MRHHLPRKEVARLVNYVSYLQGVMHLGHRDICIGEGVAEEGTNAHTIQTHGRAFVLMEFPADWLKTTTEAKTHVILHEMAHVLYRPIRRSQKPFVRNASKDQKWDLAETEEQHCEAIAMMLRQFVDPFPGPPSRSTTVHASKRCV